MGKGEIIAHKGGGEYAVRLVYAYRNRIAAKLAGYLEQIAAFDVKIASETDPAKLAILKLQRAAMQRRYDYYNNAMPADPEVDAWCADLTEDLSGNVGTIEIPGEPAQVLIRPGYDSRATYSDSRDGQLMPAVAGEPNQVLFNWMLLPGWQRHKPIYRVGTIAEIDYTASTATVCLDPAYSSQQYLPAVDGIGVSDCDASNPVDTQISSFCSRYPTHPLCTTTDQGGEINLTDQQLDDLQAVNKNINQSFGREQDKSGHRIGDSWDVFGGAITQGDCEDFALTKFSKLVEDYGWNPANLKIVTAYEPVTGQYHAMLAVRTSNKGLVVLDVNNDNVMLNGRTPYRIHRIALTKDEWVSYSRQIDGVQIEYMSCNAGAFVAGDRVVVQFADQDWTKPKVVGFEEEPRDCTTRLISLFGERVGALGYWASTMFDVTTETATSIENLNLTHYERRMPGAARLGSGVFLFGGWAPDHSMPGYSQDFEILSDNLRYSPIGGSSYTQKTAMPLPARADVAAFAIGGKGYAIGGGKYVEKLSGNYVPSATVYFDNDRYDPNADAWESLTDCPLDRGGARGFELNGIAHVVGGWDYIYSGIGGAWKRHSQNEHRAFSPVLDSWEVKTDLSEKRANGQNFSLDGYGYFFGGDDDSSDIGEYLSETNERYNQSTDAWSALSHPSGTSGFGMRPGLGAGGVGYLLREARYYYKYNPVGDTFTRGQMTSPESGLQYFLRLAGGAVA